MSPSAHSRQALGSLPREQAPSTRRAEAGRFDGLTEREREVAALIARGRSNQEIANELVLSKRTIEVHVGNILAKLGATTRGQIAAWALRKGLAERV